MIASKEGDKWSVADLNKMIKCKRFKSDSETLARKKDLIVLWDLVQGRPKPTLPKRSEEEMDMYGGVDFEVLNDLCEGDEQHQAT